MKIVRRDRWPRWLPVGTRSLLFGYHFLPLHTLFVAAGWWRLFGFPRDPRLWAAFLLHDVGYWGKRDMDGPEGEGHVFAGAAAMGWLFDTDYNFGKKRQVARLFNFLFGDRHDPELCEDTSPCHASWYCFTFYHSRFVSKKYGVEPSRLCAADKMAVAMCPVWLTLLLFNLSGEGEEYRTSAYPGRTDGRGVTPAEFVRRMQAVTRKFAESSAEKWRAAP